MRTWIVLTCIFLLGCAKKESRVSGTVPSCDPAAMTIESGSLPAPTGAGNGVAVRTGRLSVSADGACHLLALPLLGADGPRVAAALAGDFRRSYGLVRFDLPKTITTIDQSDSSFTDSTVAAAYVVHARDGGYFLDVHLAGPAKAHAKPEPAGGIALRLAVGGGAIPVAAPHARNVVVLEPRDGNVTYPIVIKGYARTFEANVQAWIEVDKAVVEATKSHATAADWMTTWGEFELTIPQGPEGDVTLFVGEESAKDGTPIGVRIPLHAASGRTAGGR